MAKFEDAAKTRQQVGIGAEMWYFLRHSKKWWLLPIIIVMSVLGALLLFGSTAAAPFIYTLF